VSTPVTSSGPAQPAGSADFYGHLAAMSRSEKEHLLCLIQDELDGGPFIGDIPEPPMEDPVKVGRAWRQTIARRVEEMRSGKVEEIDALGSAERLLLRMLQKYGP
jgi:hypothetical protein